MGPGPMVQKCWSSILCITACMFTPVHTLYFTDMAEQILSENRTNLDELATKECIDPNGSVNKSFKWIDVLARRRENQPRQESSKATLESKK